MGKHSDHTTARHGTTAKRVGLGLAVGATLVVVAFGATSTLVGAVTTENSTVHGNRFAAAIRIDGGVYELAAVPESGTEFGQGPAAGTVSFDMLPEGTQTVELDAGDTVAVDVALPAGVAPAQLPSDDTASGYTRTWSASETAGAWTVRQSVTATATGPLALPSASFGITTDFTDVRSEAELTVRATVTLPERYASTHPSDSTVMPAHWNVVAGVYRLGVTASGANTVAVKYASHPEETGERLHLVPGDVITTTVTLPAGVSPAQLPGATEADGIASSWSSTRVGQGWAVTQTQTATAPVETYGVTGGTFEASVTAQLWNAGYTVTAETVLPKRFTSAQARMEAKVPGKVSPPGVGRIAAGGGQSIAISEANRAGYGWGANTSGQVGSGSTASQVTTPTPLGPLGTQPFLQVAAGAQHTVGLSTDLRLYGWGADYNGQTGTDQKSGTNVLKPTRANPTQSGTFTQVAAGTRTSLALDTQGRAWGWGSGDFGALGADAEVTGRKRPTPLAQPTGVRFVQVEAGNQTTFAVDADGRVWGMGSNARGQLGLGTGVQKTGVFTQIPMPDGVRIVQIAANGSSENQQALALTDSGEIIAWGMNAGGEAGIGIDGSQPQTVTTPRKIQTPEGVRFTKLAAGEGVSLALSTTGQVYSWGIQSLGYQSPSQTSIPTRIQLPAVAGGYIDIAAGDAHAFALGANSALYGWGMQNQGRLGTTATGFQHTPKLISLTLTRSADEASEDTEPADKESQAETGQVVDGDDAPAGEESDWSDESDGPGVAGEDAAGDESASDGDPTLAPTGAPEAAAIHARDESE